MMALYQDTGFFWLIHVCQKCGKLSKTSNAPNLKALPEPLKATQRGSSLQHMQDLNIAVV